MYWKCTSKTFIGAFYWRFLKQWKGFAFITWKLQSKSTKPIVHNQNDKTCFVFFFFIQGFKSLGCKNNRRDRIKLWTVEKVMEYLRSICLFRKQNFKLEQKSVQPAACAQSHMLKFLLSVIVSQGMLVLMWALEVWKRTTGHQQVHCSCHPHNISLGLTISFQGKNSREGILASVP